MRSENLIYLARFPLFLKESRQMNEADAHPAAIYVLSVYSELLDRSNKSIRQYLKKKVLACRQE